MGKTAIRTTLIVATLCVLAASAAAAADFCVSTPTGFQAALDASKTNGAGGAFLQGDVAVRMSGCVVSGNLGTFDIDYGFPGGGGVYVRPTPAVEIRNSTFKETRPASVTAGRSWWITEAPSCSTATRSRTTWPSTLPEPT